VGIWRVNAPPGACECHFEFKPDRTALWVTVTPPNAGGLRTVIPARWSAEGSRLTVDCEPNPIRRAGRGRLPRTVASAGPVQTALLQFDGPDRFVIRWITPYGLPGYPHSSDGTPAVWTRVP
jgi:hypothetical protein